MLVWLGVLGSVCFWPLGRRFDPNRAALVYGFGIEAKAAMATSLLVVGVTSSLTTFPYARRAQVCRGGPAVRSRRHDRGLCDRLGGPVSSRRDHARHGPGDVA